MQCGIGATKSGSLHAVVGGATASLGHHPVDVLLGVLDITGLAVDAVLRVDLQLHVAALLVGHVLVDAGWAEALLGSLVYGKIVINRYVVILERQVSRLVALVVGASQRHRREQIEGDLPIWLGIHNGLAILGRLQRLVILWAMLQCPWLAAAQENRDATKRKAAVETQWIVEGRMHVAHLVQIFPDERILDSEIKVV